MAIIGEEDRQYLDERFGKEMQKPVEIEFFTSLSLHTDEAIESDERAEACEVSLQLYNEVADVSPLITVTLRDLDTPEGTSAAEAAGINQKLLPAAILRGDGIAGQSRHYGVPAGYEFGTLVENVIAVSRGESKLNEKTSAAVAGIVQPTHIQIFVTPT
jgi:hypothetical protein